jgi:hypothetical protein
VWGSLPSEHGHNLLCLNRREAWSEASADALGGRSCGASLSREISRSDNLADPPIWRTVAYCGAWQMRSGSLRTPACSRERGCRGPPPCAAAPARVTSEMPTNLVQRAHAQVPDPVSSHQCRHAHLPGRVVRVRTGGAARGGWAQLRILSGKSLRCCRYSFSSGARNFISVSMRWSVFRPGSSRSPRLLRLKQLTNIDPGNGLQDRALTGLSALGSISSSP